MCPKHLYILSSINYCRVASLFVSLWKDLRHITLKSRDHRINKSQKPNWLITVYTVQCRYVLDSFSVWFGGGGYISVDFILNTFVHVSLVALWQVLHFCVNDSFFNLKSAISKPPCKEMKRGRCDMLTYSSQNDCNS